MPVSATVKRLSVSVKLDAGQDPETEQSITKSVSLGSMSIEANDEGIMDVVDALKPCLTYQIDRVEKTEVNVLTNTM